MEIEFYKYQGIGNDFIMIDNRSKSFEKSPDLIARLCDRHFGIGADGLILLEDDGFLDFRMIYYNSDGNESTMCGNGGRCIVAFAHHLGLFEKETRFNAIDGIHYATIDGDMVSLQMVNVYMINVCNTNCCFLNTGSPHHIEMVNDIANYDVFIQGRRIRNDVYGEEGANINFVEQIDENTFKVRTYERGVEDETLACGTGATAVAIAMYKLQKTTSNQINIIAEGGELTVSFDVENEVFKNIFLTSKAEFVFKGLYR